MVDRNRYVFHSEWEVDAPVGDVVAVLTDFERYPEWWPEVKEVRRLDDGRFETVCRAALPYELRFVMEASNYDIAVGTIEGRLSGDLEGFSRWTLGPSGSRTRLLYDQEVVTHKRLLNVLAPVARPAFRANHALMMRHGRAGLRTFLAGYRRGREEG